MSTAPIYQMKTSAGVQIPLVRTAINGLLRDTALETTVTQHYRNSEAETIEGVYTFPLPAGATLLGIEVNLNGEVLRGAVVEAKKAQETYEDAIEDGNSALLLQKINDAMFTLNIGNLQPEDEAVVSIRYAQLLCWQQDSLRIMYPTTIGDRYGRPAALGMQPHQVTGEDPAVEHRADFSLRVVGQLAGCAVTCPSHALAIQPSKGELRISSTTAGLAMDRDIVISIQRRDNLGACAGYYDRDLDGKWVGWLSLNPRVTEELEQRSITIVVDCSGSMGGISMQQARIAVREIVERLGKEDWFNIILFGSTAQALFPEEVRARKKNKARALQMISGMDASMGGTEIGQALKLAYQGKKQAPSLKGDLLLITDGQVYEVEDVVDAAGRSGIRHFTVGVGTAVAEDLVSALATETGGACELVSPNEDMADAIVRHVKRSYVPPLSGAKIKWPVTTLSNTPGKVTHAFSGDTLHLFARFNEEPRGEVAVKLAFDDQKWKQDIPLLPYSTLPAEPSLEDLQLARLCAARRIKEAGDEEKTALGIDYQLQTVQTSYVLVAERENKDESVLGPALRTIPQMMKANNRFDRPIPEAFIRGKLGYEQDCLDVPVFSRHVAPDPDSLSEQVLHDAPFEQMLVLASKETLSFEPPAAPARNRRSPADFAQGINDYFRTGSLFMQPSFPSTLQDLESMGLDRALLQALLDLNVDRPEWDEAELVVTLLALFLRHPEASGLDKQSIRAIRKARKRLDADGAMEQAVLRVLEDDRVDASWRV